MEEQAVAVVAADQAVVVGFLEAVGVVIVAVAAEVHEEVSLGGAAAADSGEVVLAVEEDEGFVGHIHEYCFYTRPIDGYKWVKYIPV